MVEKRVVDNRVFLLGLDGFYRHAMKRHERTELLICARRVAAALQVSPANVPVEGYYSEEPDLRDYFRIMRALQQVEGSRASEVARVEEFKRLQNVTSAPLYGRPVDIGKLLAVARDPLSQALLETFPDWTVARLTGAAYEIALKTEDISLVGLAARIRDPVVLAALRESVVLYADFVFGIAQTPEYVWVVDSDMLKFASRFIDAFNTLFGEQLPRPEPASAPMYWMACNFNEILGRCVRICRSAAGSRHGARADCRKGARHRHRKGRGGEKACRAACCEPDGRHGFRTRPRRTHEIIDSSSGGFESAHQSLTCRAGARLVVARSF